MTQKKTTLELTYLSSTDDPRLGPCKLYKSKNNESLTVLSKEMAVDSEKNMNKASENLKKLMQNPSYYLVPILDFETEKISNICSTAYKIREFMPLTEDNLENQIRISKTRKTPILEQDLCFSLYQSLMGLMHLHTLGITHGRLSPEWVIRTQIGYSVLKDPLEAGGSINSTGGDFPDFSKPEKVYVSPQKLEAAQKFKPNGYNKKKDDGFALGLILLECGTLEPVFDCYNLKAKTNPFDVQKLNLKIDKLEKKNPNNVLFVSAVQKLLEIDEQRRCSPEEVLQKLPPFETIKKYFEDKLPGYTPPRYENPDTADLPQPERILINDSGLGVGDMGGTATPAKSYIMPLKGGNDFVSFQNHNFDVKDSRQQGQSGPQNGPTGNDGQALFFNEEAPQQKPSFLKRNSPMRRQTPQQLQQSQSHQSFNPQTDFNQSQGGRSLSPQPFQNRSQSPQPWQNGAQSLQPWQNRAQSPQPFQQPYQQQQQPQQARSPSPPPQHFQQGFQQPPQPTHFRQNSLPRSQSPNFGQSQTFEDSQNLHPIKSNPLSQSNPSFINYSLENDQWAVENSLRSRSASVKRINRSGTFISGVPGGSNLHEEPSVIQPSPNYPGSHQNKFHNSYLQAQAPFEKDTSSFLEGGRSYFPEEKTQMTKIDKSLVRHTPEKHVDRTSSSMIAQRRTNIDLSKTPANVVAAENTKVPHSEQTYMKNVPMVKEIDNTVLQELLGKQPNTDKEIEGYAAVRF